MLNRKVLCIFCVVMCVVVVMCVCLRILFGLISVCCLM